MFPKRLVKPLYWFCQKEIEMSGFWKIPSPLKDNISFKNKKSLSLS